MYARPLALLLPALALALAPACTQRRPDGEDETPTPEPEDTPADDDSAINPGDDDTTTDIPVFLARYDFRIVTYDNDINGEYPTISGTMDVSTSSVEFIAELSTDGGATWSWGGPLEQNEQQFLVRGYMDVPGAAQPVYVEVNGNFQANKGGSASQTCLTGLGVDDDPNQPDLGVKFAWYACQQAAPAPAVDRARTWNVTVGTNADNCGGSWSVGTWQETWSYVGRLLQVNRAGTIGWGIVSDDGIVFRYGVVEQQSNPGRALKVVGTFDPPVSNPIEGTAEGFCANSTSLIGGSLDMDYN